MSNGLPATRPAMPSADTTASRHAATLAEIQQMTTDYHSMQQQLVACQRELDARQNKIELLEHTLDESRHAERVYRNKLIRLASAMESIGRLAVDADAIMKSAREMDEAATEAAASSEG